MKKQDFTASRWQPLVSLVLLASMLILAVSGRAQLAITEVLTSASTNLASQAVAEGSDFWELTNFGTNTIDLAGYRWSDRGGTPDSAPFAGLTIRAGESILFFRLKESTNAAAFRRWWGLADTVQVIPWGTSPGLNSAQEGVQLWNASGDLVERVDVGQAQRGVSFTYDQATGVFGALSIKGVGGAFQAVTAEDIGSPGTTAGIVPAHVLQAPADVEIDGGQDATFAVRATGVPPPRYQWRFNGIVIEGATSATLTLTQVQPSEAGTYEVQVANSGGAPIGLLATLTVNTDPRPPSLLQGLEDVNAFPGQTARFTVSARGYPALSYRWLENGLEVPEAHGPVLEITDPQEAQSGTRYTVEVRNSLGVAESSARLWVVRKPTLCITEVMSWPSTNTTAITADWWELTNLDTNAVPLVGWKFFDQPNVLERGIPCVVTQAVTVQPGESVVLVEGLTPEAFVAWWGATNLPPHLTILTYAGFGLSSWGDTLYLWNPAATDPLDAVASVMFAQSLLGVTMQWAPGATWSTDSEEGSNGVFRAVQSDDVGSPGYSQYAPPRFLDITATADRVTLRWQAVAGKQYKLQYRTTLQEASWTLLGTFTSAGRSVTAQDVSQPGERQRFYRLEVSP